MSDRELLELAAKAAGVDGSYFHSDNPIHCGIYQARGEYYWNPLISDSEALRLAVKLGLEVGRGIGGSVYAFRRSDIFGINEELGLDPYAATRRAIVRAAAEIGKGQAMSEILKSIALAVAIGVAPALVLLSWSLQ